MTIDVSVVIAAWNAQHYIAEAIKSALAQTGVSLEVIVVDDASNDGTRAVVGEFQDNRLRLIAHAQNAGPSAARNTGFSAARGRWIAILDADDTMGPDRLRKMITLGEARSCQAVIDNIWVCPSDRQPYLMFPRQAFAASEFMELDAFIASNTLFTNQYNLGYTKPIFLRSFMTENHIRYDQDIRIGEDFLFLAETLAKGARCAVLPSANYFYTIQDGSLSRVLKPGDVAIMLAADERLARRVPIPAAAQHAMTSRRNSLLQAMAFLTSVDHLKARQPWPAFAVLRRTPSAVLLYRLPIMARLMRIFKGTKRKLARIGGF